MPDLSPAQKQYLFRVRREKYLIHVSRIFLFLLSAFVGSVCQTGLDRLFYLQQPF